LIADLEQKLIQSNAKNNKTKEYLVQAKIIFNRLLTKSEVDMNGIDAIEAKNRTKILQYSWALF